MSASWTRLHADCLQQNVNVYLLVPVNRLQTVKTDKPILEMAGCGVVHLQVESELKLTVDLL